MSRNTQYFIVPVDLAGLAKNFEKLFKRKEKVTLEKSGVSAEHTVGDTTTRNAAGTTNPQADPKVSRDPGLNLLSLRAQACRQAHPCRRTRR